MTTQLQKLIIAKIQNDGPLRLDEFMSIALTHPEYGYYKTQTAIGQEGDFITAPEISQMFGELCGLWGIDQMISQDIINNAAWAELGPGRGTLMKDIIRVSATALPNKKGKWSVHLVEINETLKTIQHSNLSNISNLHHYNDLNELPKIPLIFMANEFFDALPIRQFISKNGEWFERLVTFENGELTLSINSSSEKTLPMKEPHADDLIFEYAPDLPYVVSAICEHINVHGGAALIIDYGKDNAIGDSLQAVQQHQPVDILHDLGKSDLSAWVDFNAIKNIAITKGAKVVGPQHQGDFLKQLGLYQRAEQLALGANAEERRKIVAAVDRLSSPAQMGSVFKVMAILPKSHKANTGEEVAGFYPPN